MSTTPSPLTPVISLLIAAVLAGGLFGEPHLPSDDDESPAIPGSLIRELIDGKHGTLRVSKIRLQGIRIFGDVDLSYLAWQGRLDIRYSRIDGRFIIAGATLHGTIDLSHSHIDEVDANYATVAGRIVIDDGVCKRGFYGSGLSVSGALSLVRCRMTAPELKQNRSAVDLYRAHIGDLFLGRAILYGGLYANAITVDRNLRLQGVVASPRSSLGWESGPDSGSATINLGAAQVHGALYLSWRDPGIPTIQIDGLLLLGRAICGSLAVRVVDLERIAVELDHLVFHRITFTTPEHWLAYLGDLASSTPQNFAVLAAYCGDIGELEIRRRALIAAQRKITRGPSLTNRQRVRRLIWDYSVAYGYRPARALAWLTLFLFISVLIVRYQGTFYVQVGTKGRGVGGMDTAIALSLDNLLPFAGLGVAKSWVVDPQGPYQTIWMLLFVTIKFAGWATAALGLASVTGAVRKA